MSDETTVFETEERTDRAAVAAYLRALADGIEAGSVELGDGDDQVVVEPPEELEFEVELELEEEGAEGVRTTLEVEISWLDPTAGGTVVS